MSAWALLPWWLFFAIAAYCYFSPSFRALTLAFAFFCTLFVSALIPPTPAGIFLMAALFFLLFGVKDLFFVNRAAAYEIFTFLFVMVVFLNFFQGTAQWGRYAAFLAALFPAFAFFLAARSAVRLEGREYSHTKRSKTALGVSFFLIWQYAIALLMLPLNPFHQATALFMGAAFLTEFLMDYSRQLIRFEKLIAQGGIMFFATAMILWITEWGL